MAGIEWVINPYLDPVTINLGESISCYGQATINGTGTDVRWGELKSEGIAPIFTTNNGTPGLYTPSEEGAGTISATIRDAAFPAYFTRVWLNYTVNPAAPTGPTEVDAILTGYEVDSADLNTIFAGLSGLTKTTDTGYTVGTDDLSDLFAPLADGTAAAATGYEVAGADLNTIFAAKGSL